MQIEREDASLLFAKKYKPKYTEELFHLILQHILLSFFDFLRFITFGFGNYRNFCILLLTSPLIYEIMQTVLLHLLVFESRISRERALSAFFFA